MNEQTKKATLDLFRTKARGGIEAANSDENTILQAILKKHITQYEADLAEVDTYLNEEDDDAAAPRGDEPVFTFSRHMIARRHAATEGLARCEVLLDELQGEKIEESEQEKAKREDQEGYIAEITEHCAELERTARA